MNFSFAFWKQKNKDQQAAVRAAYFGALMPQLYRLVLTADLDRDTYLIVSGSTWFETLQIPAEGVYSELAANAPLLVPEWEKEHLAGILDRERLGDVFREGRSYFSELFTVSGKTYEVRIEKIPVLPPEASALRCVIYVRSVRSLEDDGITEERKRAESGLGRITENDVAAAAIFTGSYEISVEQDLLIGYERRDGTFVKTDERVSMRSAIRTWIRDETIAPESRQVYLEFCAPGFLRRKTIEGVYTVEVCLRKPGALASRWYEEMIFPVGDNFRVYRRDIDSFKRTRDALRKEEEAVRYDQYSRGMLKTLAGLVEYRNTESGPHIQNVSEVTGILLEEMRRNYPEYGLDDRQIKAYTEASIIHDIGKITIPDSILNKAGTLTEEEREVMMRHAESGAAIVERMSAAGHEEWNRCCYEVALHHHERYDGNGYPDGLSGDQVPIGVQAVGLADAFDSLCSKRVYKPAMPCSEALEMIENEKCGVFNPKLIAGMKSCFDELCRIYGRES